MHVGALFAITYRGEARPRNTRGLDTACNTAVVNHVLALIEN